MNKQLIAKKQNYMRTILFLLILIIIFSCNSQTRIDLKIPDKIQPSRSPNSQQFPGTRLFIVPPKGYQLVQQLIRFQKNDSTFLQFYEITGSAFDVQKLKTKIEENKRSGRLAKEYYQKDLQFGPYHAIFIYGPDNRPNREQIMLSFGDNNFVIMALGELTPGDTTARNELVSALLSTYVDTTIKVDSKILETYSLDVSGSEFKYVGNFSQSYFYNYRGKPLDNNDKFADQIIVSTLPAQDESTLKEWGKSMIKRYKINGIEIPNYKEREFMLNGNYAYEIEFDGSYKGRPNSVYQIVTTNGSTSSAMLLGSAYNDRKNLINQIKQVATTLRLK